ncbi:unnamed protein product [Meganyctiphanes norvegica]|uniref:Uncharacterized protein n=1 Tax=Meganyctiphanes norvegica TaxID=48144 RepID=A0AAV2PVR1_MEGNR
MNLSSLSGSSVAACIIGAAVADAAARPLHWVYSKDDMDQLLQQNRHAEFWPQSHSPFYKIPTGERSCYNHLVTAGLEAFVEAAGKPELELYKATLKRKFGEGTVWQEALARRKQMYAPERKNEKKGPVEGPWIQGSIIYFLEHGKGDPANTQMDGFLLSLPHLLFNYNKSGVVQECQEIASLLNGTPKFPKCQLEILQKVLQTKSFTKADVLKLDEEVQGDVNTVFDNLEEDHVSFVNKVGKSCACPGALQGSLHAFLMEEQKQSPDQGESRFRDAVRATIAAGGCNCSRGNFLGALFGAHLGMSAIPTDWIEKVADIDIVIDSIKKASNVAL